MIKNKSLVLIFSITFVVASMPVFNAMAQSSVMTNQQIELIRSNCVSVKNTLKQLHASDALLRVNMGQIYESMLTKLMIRFNDRVKRNNLGNASLVQSSDNFNQSLNNFRTDYKLYEEQLAITLNVDCSTQPVQFYESTQAARTKRSKVHADVVKIKQYTEQYKSEVDRFEKDFQKISGGGNR